MTLASLYLGNVLTQLSEFSVLILPALEMRVMCYKLISRKPVLSLHSHWKGEENR